MTQGPVWAGVISRPHRDSIPHRSARSSVTVLFIVVCIFDSCKLSCVQLLLVGLVYCWSYLMFICCTVCVLLFLLQMPDCWLEVSIRKVLRPVTSTQVSLGFPLSISKRSDGSQHSKLPLHASHVALRT